VRQLPSILFGVLVFLLWLSVVGNPHVVETVIGLILGVGAAIFFHLKILNRFWPPKD
jgi:multisubunit Na+/H+ antiporter MnhE subunit